MSDEFEFGSPQFDEAVRLAGRRAFEETLAGGRPAFCVDDEGVNAMFLPDGRKFEIRWIPGAPAGENYEIVREVTSHAA